MNQENTQVSWQPHAPVPYAHVHQHTNPNQSTTFFQGGFVNFRTEETLTVPSVATTGTQTSETPLGTIRYYREMESYKKHYCVPQFPVGYFQEGQGFPYEGCAKMLSINMSSPQTLQPLPSVPVNTTVNDTSMFKRENLEGPRTNTTLTKMTVREKTVERTPSLRDAGSTTDMAVTGDETETGPAGDSTAYQVHKTSSSLPQGVAGPSAHSTTKPMTDAVQKRELRLMKNREAARECRRKKKEYVKCLENRVAVLENQNKTLIEELRTLKDIYRHKVELAAKQSRKKKRLYLDQLKSRNTVLEMENQALKAQLQSLQDPNV